MGRRLVDFIDGFQEFARTFNTTNYFTLAGGMWMVSTAVLRSVGMKARGNNLHPNMFVEMVGGPGTGKSQCVNAIKRVMVPATKMSFIPASVTRAGLEDYMADNMKQRNGPDGLPIFSNECIGLSEEMQGILPDQDLGHLTLYNILYDLPSVHMARTRSNGEVRLEAPYCSIFTGAQPSFLALTIPEGAWGMGFMSRSILVFDTPGQRRSAFEHRDIDHKLLSDLIHDLKEIHSLKGWMEWTKDAIELYNEWWVENGGLPIPQAKRLAMGYNSRRELHFLKFAMTFSLSRSNDLIVTVDDCARAIETLLKLEDRMRHIFDEMAQTGAMVAIQDVLDVVRTNTASGKPTDEGKLVELLMQRFPSTQVHATIENLISSGAISANDNNGKPLGLPAKGFRKFVVGRKTSVL